MYEFINNGSFADILKKISKNMIKKRKLMKLSQNALAKKSGVSLGSIKRFESKSEISLSSLVKISIVLDCVDDFKVLFDSKTYSSIDEVING